jgi:hypothetical protein
MVVGDPIQARLGKTGLWGPHGTLAELSDADMKKIVDEIQQSYKSQPRHTVRPRTPSEMRQIRTELDAIRTALRRYDPIDREAIARDDRCVPFWPSSRRRMDRSTAVAEPRSASWKCELVERRAWLVVRKRGMPILEARLSGGMGFTTGTDPKNLEYNLDPENY